MLIPESEGRLGFPAYYDRCYASAMASLHEGAGFEVVQTRVSHYQSEYYAFFVPAYVLSSMYELLLYGAGAKRTRGLRLAGRAKPA